MPKHDPVGILSWFSCKTTQKQEDYQAEPEEMREWIVKPAHMTIVHSTDELCNAIPYLGRPVSFPELSNTELVLLELVANST